MRPDPVRTVAAFRRHLQTPIPPTPVGPPPTPPTDPDQPPIQEPPMPIPVPPAPERPPMQLAARPATLR